MTDYALAANFIEQFEGYTPVAKWDVNAYRLGYGSDTEGPDQVKVTKGMATTRERAFANLEVRIPKFAAVIIDQVGSIPWAAVPDQAQAALLSIAYNYGDLPPNVAWAVFERESLAIIASAVEALDGDNHGVNKARRMKEAAYIASADKAVKALATAEALPAAVAPDGFDVSTVLGLQAALNLLEKTIPSLVVDGTYGPLTVAKMKAFQTSEKLKPTGDTTFNSALAVREALQKAGVPVAPIT